MAAVACAIGAAIAYAVASVVQQRAAAAQPPELAMRPSLLARLARRPAWLAGVAADVAGYGLQFVALGLGSLAVVQPLLVSGLLLALPLAALVDRRQVRRRDWVAAVAVCVGLATFLVVAAPAQGRDDTTGGAWIVVSAALLIPAAALARRRRPRSLAAAAGIVYAYTAALTKTTAHLFTLGIGPLLRTWQPYALVACGVGGMLLAQSAFQSGSLDESLPTLTVVDPVVSVLVGAFAFDEAIRSAALAVGVEVVALALVAAGVFRLGDAVSGHARVAG